MEERVVSRVGILKRKRKYSEISATCNLVRSSEIRTKKNKLNVYQRIRDICLKDQCEDFLGVNLLRRNGWL